MMERSGPLNLPLCSCNMRSAYTTPPRITHRMDELNSPDRPNGNAVGRDPVMRQWRGEIDDMIARMQTAEFAAAAYVVLNEPLRVDLSEPLRLRGQ